jgi:hypothetical protein
MKKDILNELSTAIFKRPFITLKKREMAFVREQEGNFRKYQDLVREKALPIMDKKKLSTREYNIIREWFFKTIPSWCVLQAIDACLENSRGTGRAIYSLAFFKAHVAGLYRAHLRRQSGGRIFQDPWGFEEWRHV